MFARSYECLCGQGFAQYRDFKEHTETEKPPRLHKLAAVNMTKDDAKVILESLVDTHGARMVAESLVEVFHDKAEHIGHEWQDGSLAKVWRKVATKLGNAVHWQNLEWPS